MSIDNDLSFLNDPNYLATLEEPSFDDEPHFYDGSDYDDTPSDQQVADDQPVLARGEGATPTEAGHGYARRFPVEQLPRDMREYVLDLAARKQVPTDLVALTMLGVLSGVTGPRIVVRRDLGFIEPTNLYVLTGMASGSAKSPAVTEIRNGLWKANNTLAEQHASELAQRQLDLNEEIEDCYKRAKHPATPLEEQEGLKARAKQLEAEALELAKKPPAAPILALDGDTTPEALADKMAKNGGYGAVIDDEGTLLRNLGGQYSGRTANLGIVLKGYDCSPYNPTRVTRETGQIGRASLAVVVSPQPGLVADMLRNGVMDETGFINRFLLSLPGDLVGKRVNRPSVFIDDDLGLAEDKRRKAWWSNLLNSLVEYRVIADAQALDQELEACGQVIDMTREAYNLHYQFQCAFESRMDPTSNGDLSRVRGWAAKHVARVLRLAALLHLASGKTPDDRLSERVMHAAIAIGAWSIEHFLMASRVVGLSDGAGRIKEHIDGTEMGWSSRTEINALVFKKNVAAAQLDMWIDELLSTGDYEVAKITGSGRPKTVIKKVGTRTVIPAE
jgi:hypothetical protein